MGHWTFDNADVSGNTIEDTAPFLGDQDGTKTNGGPTTGVLGVVGEAAGFAGGANNGDHEFVDLGAHAATFGTLTAGTISAWVKPEASGTGNPTDTLTVFSVSSSNAPSQEMRLFVSNGGSFGVGKLAYGVRSGTLDGNVTSSASNLFDGQWHHVAVTVSGSQTASLYIDGNFEGSANISFMTDLSADASAIGRNLDDTAGSGGQWFFGGGMDDVGLWNDALTPNEVKALVSLAEHVQLNYDLGQAAQLFDLADAGSGTAVVGGRTWAAAMGLSGAEGEIVADTAGRLSLNLDGGIGVQSDAVPLVVTSTADLGPGTLRAAIDEANAISGADTITFDALFNTAQTIALNSQLPTITNDLTISGPGAELLTVDAQLGGDGMANGNGYRIFNVDDGTAALIDVAISGMTLTGGDLPAGQNGGGAIRSRENLVLANVLLTGNSAQSAAPSASEDGGGAIFASDGKLQLLDSTMSGNSSQGRAGALRLRNMSEVSIERSTFDQNESTAEWGGAIHAGNSSVVIDASTFTQNSAVDPIVGGGGRGGAILVENGSTMLITNSTFSANAAIRGGAIAVKTNTTQVTIRQSTISGNTADYGGGIYNQDGAVTVNGTIVANDSAQNSGNDLAGTFTVNWSLIEDAAGATINGADNITGLDPLLGPLADNGGPTLTHAPLPGSPAINAGDPNFDPNDLDPPLVNDQRGPGFPRVQLDRVDIGAVEFDDTTIPVQGLVVDVTDDVFNGIYTVGDLSLREAVALANANLGADTITFDASLSGQTILLGGTELVITDTLTIDASSLANNVIIDANHQSRVLNFTSPTGDLTLASLTLQNGQTTDGSGGGIRFASFVSSGDLAITNSIISGNSAQFLGGGLYIHSTGTATITNSTLSGNSALYGSGGGLFLTGSVTATITGSTISDNSAQFDGGGIANITTVTITSSTISGNTAESFGGGISNFGTATITNSTVSGNSATSEGGGLLNDGTATITNSTLSGNSAIYGGGLLNDGTATITGSTLSGNSAGSWGGGLLNLGTATITNSTLSGNSATSEGGGLLNYSTGSVTLNNTIVANSLNGGDIVNPSGTLNGAYNLIEDGQNLGSLTHTVTGDPLLGPLADNGGPTFTHALLPGSPAHDAGDPGFDPADPDGDPMTDDALPFDQRGEPFVRVFDGGDAGGARIDIGAFEFISEDAVHALFGDYNRDFQVNAADYTTWRNSLGQTGLTPYSGADGDGDGEITQNDYQVWKDNYGTILPLPGTGATADEVAVATAVLLAEPPAAPAVEPVRDAAAGKGTIQGDIERVASNVGGISDADFARPIERTNGIRNVTHRGFPADRATPAPFNEDELLLLATNATMVERREGSTEEGSTEHGAVDAAFALDGDETDSLVPLATAFGDWP